MYFFVDSHPLFILYWSPFLIQQTLHIKRFLQLSNPPHQRFHLFLSLFDTFFPRPLRLIRLLRPYALHVTTHPHSLLHCPISLCDHRFDFLSLPHHLPLRCLSQNLPSRQPGIRTLCVPRPPRVVLEVFVDGFEVGERAGGIEPKAEATEAGGAVEDRDLVCGRSVSSGRVRRGIRRLGGRGGRRDLPP